MSLEKATESVENHCSVPKLKRLIMQLTSNCNSNCYFCMNGGAKVDESSFNREVYENIIQELILNEKEFVQLESVAFTGGEPLLEKELLLEIARFNQGVGLETMLVSNAILGACRRIAVQSLSIHGVFAITGQC